MSAADLYAKTGRFDEVLATTQKLLKVKTKLVPTLLFQSAMAFERARPDGGETAFRKAVKADQISR